jgi:hypothetical protein
MLNKTGHRSVAALFAALARIKLDDRDAAVAQLKQAILSYDSDYLRALRDLLLDGARLRMQEAQALREVQLRAAQTKCRACVIFSGCCDDADPKGAAAAFRRAGYEVRRWPYKYMRSGPGYEPGDATLDVMFSCIEAPEVLKTCSQEIDRIAHQHGGECEEFGRYDPDYHDQPFQGLTAR